MAEEKVTVTTETEETPKASANPETEAVKAEKEAQTAEKEAQTAEKEAQEAESQATEATEAAAEATKAAEKAEQVTSSNESAINGLKESINLAVQRIEQIATITKETAGTVESLATELRATLDLNQEQIGTLDAAAQNVVLATAALTKIHKEQTVKKA